MTDYHAIYRDHADAYDRLVSAEDCDGHLLPAIEALLPRPLEGASVVEVGVGTGRVTRLLASRGARLFGVEPAPAMLAIARRHLEKSWGPCELHCAEASALPFADASADLAIAGWVFGHQCSWQPGTWRASIGRGLAEMGRVLRPGGALVLIETLGTGKTEPAAPSPALAEYFRWLEEVHGFARQSIRTDYSFPTVEVAAEVTGAFFGEAFAARVREEGWTRVPECTGIWSRRM